MTRLLLIRHGQSESNHLAVFAGQSNPALTQVGIDQAKSTAKFIAENYKVDKIYASDLKRAYDTALCLGQLLDMEVIPEPGLREIYAGKWEQVKFTEIIQRYPEEYDVWLHHIGQAVCVGGESVRQMGERVLGTLTKIARENDGKTVAVGTHATPIRVTQSLLQTGGLEEMENIPWVSNASVTVIEYNEGIWKIAAVSQDEHLAQLRSTLPANV